MSLRETFQKLIILTLAIFVLNASCGHIFVRDPVIDISNLGSVSIFDFRFMLETGLPSTGSMTIEFPFILPSLNTQYWFPITKNCLTPDDHFKNQLSISSAGSNIVMKFRNLLNNGVALQSNQWYNIHLEFYPALGISLVGALGNQLPVKAFTKSSDNIIYDYNNNFALFKFNGAYSANLDVFPFLTEDSMRDAVILDSFGAQREFVFEILPRVRIENYARIQVVIDSSGGFNFTNPELCKSYVTSQNTPALSLDLFSCTLETQNMLWIQISTSIIEEKLLRFGIPVSFPLNYKISTAGVAFRTVLANERTVVEARYVPKVFQTRQYTWRPESLRIRVAWGLTPSEIFRIYRNSNGGSDTFYNSLRFEFSPSISTPQGFKGDVMVLLTSDPTVLEGTIVHNLPPFDALKPVQCEVSSISTNTGTTKGIRCSEVAGLSPRDTYFISAKIQFLYDAADPNFLGNEFGKLYYFPYLTSLADSNSLYAPLASTDPLFIRNNIQNAQPTSGYFSASPNPAIPMAVFTDTDLTGGKVGNGGLGVKVDSKIQQISFIIKQLATGDFGSQFFTGTGIDIYSSSVVEPQANYRFKTEDCLLDITRSGPNHFEFCNVRKIYIDSKNPYISSTNYRLGSADATSFSSDFGGSERALTFKNIIVKKHASIYPGQEILDFYFATASTGLNSDSTTNIQYYKYFAINSLTITPSNSEMNIKIALSNYIGRSSLVYTDGNRFPLVLRIFGELSADEQKTSYNKIIVFFDYLNVFQYGFEAGSSESFTRSKYAKGQINTFNPLYNQKHRISVEMPRTFGKGFQLVIPFALNSNIGGVGSRTLSIQVALATLDDNIISIKSYSGVESALTQSGTYGINDFHTILQPGVSGADLNLVLGSRKVADVGAGKINTFLTGFNAVDLKNDGTNEGASFLWTTDYNFFSSKGFSASSTLVGTTVKTGCLTFSYKYSSSDSRYSLYCPLTSEPGRSDTGITLQSFVYPYTSGVMGPNSWGVLSDRSGRAFYLTEGVKSIDRLSPNEIKIDPTSTTSPLYSNEKNMIVGFNFELMSTLAKTVKFEITSDEPLNFIIPTESHSCKLVLRGSQYTGKSLSFSSCTASFAQNSIFATVTAVNSDIIFAGLYTLTIQFIMVVSYPVSAQNLFINAYTDKGSMLSKTFSPGKIYYKMNDTRPYYMEFENPVYQYQDSNVIGSFNVSFYVVGREIWSTEKVFINLEPLGTNNEGTSDFECTVRNSNGTLSFEWKTCSFTDLGSITLIPETDILQKGQKFFLHLRNIKPATSKILLNISASLRDSLDNTMLSKTIQLPEVTADFARQMIYPQILFEKSVRTIGFHSTFRFWLTFRFCTLNSSSVLLIIFPRYYSPNLANGPVYVLINNISVNFVFDGPRTIKISKYQGSIAPNQTFSLIVEGVILPNYVSSSPITFLMDQDSDPTHINEFGSVNDWLPDSSVALAPYNLEVGNFSVDTNQIQKLSTYRIDFKMPIVRFDNRNFTVIFSGSWSTHLDQARPFCSIKNSTDTDWKVLNCSFQGSKLNITSEFNYTLNGLYNLKISNIPNPLSDSCIIDQPIIQIASISTGYVEYTTWPSLTTWPLKFFKLKGLSYWRWNLVSRDIRTPLVNNLRIKRGQYSQMLALTIDQEQGFNQKLVFTMINYFSSFANVEVYPKDLVGDIGRKEILFRLGAPVDSVPGTYELLWNLQQNLPELYAVPDPLKIEIVDEPIDIPALGIAPVYNLVELGISENIIVDMSDNPPMNPIYLDIVIPFYPDVGVDYGKSSRLTITKENPIAYTYLLNTYYFPGMQRNSYFYLTIPNVTPFKELYRLPTKNNNQYQININPANNLGLYSLDVEFRDPGTNDVTLRIFFSEPGFIYYNAYIERLAYLREDNTASKIKDRLNGDVRITGYLNNITREISGVIIYSQANLKVELPINQLVDNTDYVIDVWGSDSRGNFSSPVTIRLKTKDIKGNFQARVAVYSESQFNRQDLEDLACTFSDYFRVPGERVRTPEGFTCIRRQSFNTSSNSSANATNNSLNVPSIAVQSNDWVFSENPGSPIYYYFLPSYIIREQADLVSSELIKNLTTARVAPSRSESYLTPLINDIWSKPRNKSKIQNISFLGNSDPKIPGIIMEPTLLTTPTTIELRDLQLNTSAFVFALLEKVQSRLERVTNQPATLPDIMPTFEQMKTGQNLSSYPLVYKKKFGLYVPGESFSLKFEDVDTFTIYRVYYQVATEDPLTPAPGPLRAYVVETKFPNSSGKLKTVLALILTLFLLIIQ